MPSSRASLPDKKELIKLYRQAIFEASLDEVDQKLADRLSKVSLVSAQDKQIAATHQHKLSRKVPRWMRVGAYIIPAVCVTAGMYLLGSAVMPIAAYYVSELPAIQARQLVSPIPEENILDSMPLVISQLADASLEDGQTGRIEPIILDSQLDFTNLSNWFEGAVLPELQSGQSGIPEETYTIEIPSLNIKNATVTVGGTNLNKSLVHFQGTALPGQAGSPVIFGHSVLRQFYNPSEKNPRRYNTIFSTIMTMKKGEKILVTRQGVTYTYLVQDKTEVKPTDTYILAQKYDNHQLKLVTCTPEGTYLRRGVVTAVLVSQ
jgi:LPXTG-site transpeptidase (sortase) family protein